MALISSRRRAVTAKAAGLIEAFEARHGRAPTSYERERLSQHAALITRRAKSHTRETRDQLLDRIDARIRGEVAGGLSGVADAALAARADGGPAVRAWSPTAVIETALADMQSRKAVWPRADLTVAIKVSVIKGRRIGSSHRGVH